MSVPVWTGMVTATWRPLVPEGQVAPTLSVFHEALGLEEADQLTRAELREPGHQGIPTVSSWTCTSRSFWGTGWS